MHIPINFEYLPTEEVARRTPTIVAKNHKAILIAMIL